MLVGTNGLETYGKKVKFRIRGGVECDNTFEFVVVAVNLTGGETNKQTFFVRPTDTDVSFITDDFENEDSTNIIYFGVKTSTLTEITLTDLQFYSVIEDVVIGTPIIPDDLIIYSKLWSFVYSSTPTSYINVPPTSAQVINGTYLTADSNKIEWDGREIDVRLNGNIGATRNFSVRLYATAVTGGSVIDYNEVVGVYDFTIQQRSLRLVTDLVAGADNYYIYLQIKSDAASVAAIQFTGVTYSITLPNVFSTPWDGYKVKTYENIPDVKQVDLLKTFLFLSGGFIFEAIGKKIEIWNISFFWS